MRKKLRNFNSKASHRLSEMFKLARQDGMKPELIGNNVWNNILEKWNMLVYQSKCQTTSKYRPSGKGDNFHTGELISVHEHVYIWYEFLNVLLFNYDLRIPC